MKLIKSKFSDRHRPKSKTWKEELRNDLARGVNRPMFPDDKNDDKNYAKKYEELKRALVGNAPLYSHEELINRAKQLVNRARK